MVDKDLCVHYYNVMTRRDSVGNYTFGTLLDSGCNKSNVNWELVKRLKLTHAIRPPEIETFKMASGDMLKALGCVNITLRVKDFQLPFTFHVSRN